MTTMYDGIDVPVRAFPAAGAVRKDRPMTDDLVTWLRAQLDDDEQVARVMPGPSPEQRSAAGDRDYLTPVDPARVLAEVDAKRRILDRCAEVIGDRDLGGYDRWGSLAEEPNALALFLAVETMRDLFLPYADREGFREEWRPA